jgi:hypothetical protein
MWAAGFQSTISSQKSTMEIMSVAEQIPVASPKKPFAPARRNGRWAGYTHLLGARLLELKREPEVVFWVFVFPLLLALGLGIAFRNKPGSTYCSGLAGCAIFAGALAATR